MNLGHCHRKLKNYDRAIEYYQQCLSINGKNPSTYASLGFAYHLKRDFTQAMGNYNQANFLKSDDPFINSLIHKALSDIQEMSFEEVVNQNNI